MAFDIEMIKQVYNRLPERVEAARKLTGKPLTASEKILYSHLWGTQVDKALPQTELLVKMLPPKWLCCSLCNRERIK
jgi:aconitate hydratase